MYAPVLPSLLSRCLTFTFLMAISSAGFAQNTPATKPSEPKIIKHQIGPNGFDEMILSAIRKDGGSEERVQQYIEYKKQQWQDRMKMAANPSAYKDILPKPLACGNVNVEQGNFSGWTGQTGTTNGTQSPTWSASGIVPTQHGIAPPPASDPCANAANPIPLPAPNGGSFSIKLGNNQTGYGAEMLSFTFTPGINDTLFTYQYAVVFEDPGHSAADQPFFEFYMLDQNGDTVPCSHQRYIAAPTIPGFLNSTICSGVKYKPWTLVGINLSAYIGQPVTLFAVNADCNQGGHFGYSYIDFSCTPGTMPTAFCQNATNFTVCAPGGGAGYTFQWETGSTSSCINVAAPKANDTITLVITPPGTPSCPFPIDLILTPVVVNPGFMTSISCGNLVKFTDTSNFAPFGVALNYSWNFGDPASGPNNTTTQQHPTHLFSGPGTYTVTLTTMATIGTNTCGVAPYSFPVTITGPPIATFTNNSPCVGDPTTFTDQSTPSSGANVSGWSWNFGDPASGSNNTSTQQNPSHVFTSPGTYSVNVTITDSKGCTDFSVQVVQVIPPPQPGFTGYGSGCAPLCPVALTDTSNPVYGTITSWAWTFPGGIPSSSTLQNPTVCYQDSGSYNATLIVVTSSGCTDTVTIGPIADVFGWPIADFCVEPNPASVTDPNFLFCDLWTSDVTQWTWDFGDGTTDNTSTDPFHSYITSISANDFYSFEICLNVQNTHGCWDTICKIVEILPEFQFYIPNTFTPNKDGKNDFFFGKGIGIMEYEIWLFDRWGNLIWNCHQIGKSTDYDGPGQEGMPAACKWDGVVKPGGADMSGNSGFRTQEDVYVWKVELTDIFLSRHTYVGHVNLVK